MKPYWVTFYSYKGGVGRTLAMVNSAVILARSGRNVLLVDFDLEAPGLDSFPELGLTIGRPGVVEYFADFIASRKAPKLANYVETPTPTFRTRGNIIVMPSGRKDREYNRRRDGLNWSEQYDSGFGQLMIAEWKATIATEYQLDYVFVDSRTGLTDIGGVCTLDLPDLIVALLALNRQNVDGVASVISAIDRADIGRRPDVLAVATPVPSGSIDNAAIDNAVSAAEAVVGRRIDLRISYNPSAALSEKIFVLESTEKRSQLVLEYEDLVEKIKTKNVSGLDGIIGQSRTARENEDEQRTLINATILERDFGSRADAVLELAEVTRRFGDRQSALPLWEKAFALDPTLLGALNPLITSARIEQNYGRIVELCDKYLVAIGPESAGDIDVGFKKAEALMALSRPQEAIPYYFTSAEADPTDLTSKFNVAEAIRRTTGKADQSQWSEVIKLFEKKQPVSAMRESNQAQAMHIAYACVGNLERAKDFLQRAALYAAPLPNKAVIFSVRRYAFVAKTEFLEDNRYLLLALERGELWDGMKLGDATVKSTGVEGTSNTAVGSL